MIVFQGLNLLSRMAYYMAQKHSIDVGLMHSSTSKTIHIKEQEAISQRWVLINQYSLEHLELPSDFGHEIHRLQTYTLHRGNFLPGFQVASHSLEVPFLGKMCHIGALNALYAMPEPEHILEFNPELPSWCSQKTHAPDNISPTLLGFARQIILNTKGDHHCAFQIFDWPLVLGLLPINEHQTVLVYSTSDPEKIDKPLSPDFEFELAKLLKPTPLSLVSIEKVGEVAPLQSYHANSYRDRANGLFGEAIHKIHPLAGQGLNMGIADALCLLELCQDNIDHYDLIQKFEKNRWLNNAMIHNFCQQMSLSSARWWAPPLFRAFNRSKALQQKFFSYALQIDTKKELEIIF